MLPAPPPLVVCVLVWRLLLVAPSPASRAVERPRPVGGVHRLYIHRTHTSAALRLTAPIWGRSARCANGTHRARFAQVPCPDPCPYSCALCPLTQPSLYPGPPLALARPLELNVSVTVRRCTVGSAVRVTPVC
eukprot:EG_transcript_16777